MIEVPGEFYFLVTDGGDFGESALEIRLHQVAHAVELNAELIDFMFSRGPANFVREQGGGADGSGSFKKAAAIHHDVFSKGNRNAGQLYARNRPGRRRE